jgi:hypothetical protein
MARSEADSRSGLAEGGAAVVAATAPDNDEEEISARGMDRADTGVGRLFGPFTESLPLI